MRVKLSEDRKSRIAQDLVDLFAAEFDEDISMYRANAIVEFLLRKIGPSQYNQAISDARAYMAEKLDDLDTEFSEPDEVAGS